MDSPRSELMSDSSCYVVETCETNNYEELSQDEFREDINMESPVDSEPLSESSCYIFETCATNNDEESSQDALGKCLDKFAVYVYFTLRKRGLFNDVSKSIEEISTDYQVELLTKTLVKQQQRLLLHLLTVEEDPNLEETMNDIIEAAVSAEEPVVSTLNKDEEEEVEPGPLQTEREKDNLMFMQAMTRLKSFVGSHLAVPRTAIQDLLTPMVGPSATPLSDSGCCTLETQQSTSTGNAGGNVNAIEINNVMRASRCNEILSQSVDAVIKRLRATVSKDDVSIYENWEGSYMDLSVSTLNQLVQCLCLEDEDNEVRKKLSDFIEDVIVDILTYEGMNNQLLYFKTYFVISLIDNIHTCYDTIEFLFEKLGNFESYAKNPQYNYTIPINTTETSFYIFDMLDMLLQYYISETKAMSVPKSGYKGRRTCEEEWMRAGGNRSNEGNPFVDEQEVKENKDRWIKLLEQYIISFTGTFCLHAVKGSEILYNVLQPEL